MVGYLLPSPAYPNDLNEAEWAVLAPLIPAGKQGERPRSVAIRRIVDGVLYVLLSGYAWRYLPREYGPWQTVHHYFRKWCLDATWAAIHAQLRELARLHAGRDPTPSAAIFDSQSVKTLMDGVRRFDSDKKLVGRNRNILVDTHGFLLAVVVHPSNIPACGGSGPIKATLVGSSPGEYENMGGIWRSSTSPFAISGATPLTSPQISATRRASASSPGAGSSSAPSRGSAGNVA